MLGKVKAMVEAEEYVDQDGEPLAIGEYHINYAPGEAFFHKHDKYDQVPGNFLNLRRSYNGDFIKIPKYGDMPEKYSFLYWGYKVLVLNPFYKINGSYNGLRLFERPNNGGSTTMVMIEDVVSKEKGWIPAMYLTKIWNENMEREYKKQRGWVDLD
jgi:hypothetical protein